MESSRAARRVAPVAVGAPCVAVVMAYGELHAATMVAVAGTGAALAGVALARQAGKSAPPVGRRGLPWLLWLAAALAWEALALAEDDLPTLSDLLDPLLRPPVVRGGATVAWLAAGAWLLARPPAERTAR